MILSPKYRWSFYLHLDMVHSSTFAGYAASSGYQFCTDLLSPPRNKVTADPTNSCHPTLFCVIVQTRFAFAISLKSQHIIFGCQRKELGQISITWIAPAQSAAIRLVSCLLFCIFLFVLSISQTFALLSFLHDLFLSTESDQIFVFSGFLSTVQFRCSWLSLHTSSFKDF